MYIFLQKLVETFFNERSRWFSFVPILFSLGIGVYFLFSFEPSIWATLIILELLLVTAYIVRTNLTMLFAIAVVSIAALGFTSIQLKANYLAKSYKTYENEKLYLHGKVKSIDYNYRGMPRLLLSSVKDYDDNTIGDKVRISLLSKKDVPEIGACVEMIALFRPPLEPVMVGGYQFNRKYFFEGFSAVGSSMSRVLELDCSAEEGIADKLLIAVSKLRQKAVGKIMKILPPDEASITSALVAGEKGHIKQKLYNNYRDSGLAHFLSISGLHMSMIAGLMFFLIRFVVAIIPPIALRYDGKKISAVFAIVMSLVYLLISGAEIPSQRAFIMTTIVLIGVLISRRAISMKTISWAALIILIFSPQALIGASFQMSFAAVVCLIAFYERYAVSLSRFLNRDGMSWILKVIFVYIGGLLVADLVASLATLPFAIYHFNRIAVFTTLGNLLAGPIIGLIIMPFVLVALLLMPFGLEYLPLKVVGWGVGLVNDITAWVSSLPNAGYQVVSMPFWGLMMIVFGGLWLCIWQEKWRRFGWIGIFAGVLSVFMVKTPDLIVNEDVFAVKDNHGKLVVMPERGINFEKKMWLEKNASKPLTKEKQDELKKIYKGQKVDKNWLDLSCDESKCEYKGLVLNKAGGVEGYEIGSGASFWIDGDVIKYETISDYVGQRLWACTAGCDK